MFRVPAIRKIKMDCSSFNLEVKREKFLSLQLGRDLKTEAGCFEPALSWTYRVWEQRKKMEFSWQESNL